MKADEVPDGGLVHFAVGVLRFGSIIRQRCAWCGALIDEVDIDNIAIPLSDIPEGVPIGQHIHDLFLDENDDPKQRWSGLVWIAEGFPTVKYAVDPPEDGKAPAKSCMRLDVEVTR